MARKRTGILFIGIGGHIAAIDPVTGAELWRTKLKSSPFVTLQQEGARVFAGAGGELFCLDAATGSVLWCNRLKGPGTGLIAFASTTDAASAAALQAQEAASVAATTAAT